MIFGGSPFAPRVWTVLLLFAAGVCSSAAVAAETGDVAGWDIKRLMQELGQVKTAKGRFVERKHLGILNVPLEFSGTLVYVAPSRLEKHTLAPRMESLVLDREELTIESKERNQRRALVLLDYPVIWAFVESIRSTLAGDLPTLSRFYQVSLEGGERRWRLTLKPSEPGMQDVVSEIRISGERSWINTIEIIETGGDRSVMTITRDAP
ncbi:MAG TPA: outer membrane lipoprotein carrier protein LolA [Burkholderiales bacterium]|nr:outer membrane lipoprotein carrier protein LolA [Burkholderiales bacterium]